MTDIYIYTYTEVSEVIGVPLNHPCIDGFSLMNHPAIGVPPFVETSTYLVVLVCLSTRLSDSKGNLGKYSSTMEHMGNWNLNPMFPRCSSLCSSCSSQQLLFGDNKGGILRQHAHNLSWQS